MSASRTEVCIIGGGPAGAVAAIRLTALGHQVCLLERSASARHREGESLTPGIWPILEMLGLRDRVAAAGFVPGTRSHVRWASERVEEVEQRGHEPGLIVDRACFDELLLTAAAEQGARVLRSAAAPIQGDFIESCRALHHPSQQRAMAFLGNVELAPLLDEVERGGTMLDIVRRWTPWVSMRRGLEIAAWLLANGLLRPSGPRATPPPFR